MSSEKPADGSPHASASVAPAPGATPVLRGRILRWLNHRLAERSLEGAGADPNGYDPAALAATLEHLRTLGSWVPWFRREASGFEHVPAAPALVVMNQHGQPIRDINDRCEVPGPGQT